MLVKPLDIDTQIAGISLNGGELALCNGRDRSCTGILSAVMYSGTLNILGKLNYQFVPLANGVIHSLRSATTIDERVRSWYLTMSVFRIYLHR